MPEPRPSWLDVFRTLWPVLVCLAALAVSQITANATLSNRVDGQDRRLTRLEDTYPQIADRLAHIEGKLDTSLKGN